MKVFFVRTPRYLWPFHSENSGFWQPLGFASMAAVLRKELPELVLRIIDCPAEKIGWKTLARRLAQERPDIVCIGEETVSAHEGYRLASLAKDVNPNVTIIAGGYHYPYVASEALRQHPIDFIVQHEGEYTLLELVRALLGGTRDYDKIPGIMYQQDGDIRSTEGRPLIRSLDSLPLPAYDLLPMHLYGRLSRNHKHLVAMEHSRGCIDTCAFCILWKHWGAQQNGEMAPSYRTKSPEATFDHLQHVVKTYDRQTICWVDPTWNADADWTDRFCELVLASGLKVRFVMWARSDYIVRDQELGVLEKLVRAGLVRVIMGIERVDPTELNELSKHNNDAEITNRALDILKRYPSVYTIASGIFGIRQETARSMKNLFGHMQKSRADYCFYVPLTPNPGTRVWEEAHANGWIDTYDFRHYNFYTPVLNTETLSAKDMERLYARMLMSVTWARLIKVLRQLKHGSPAWFTPVHLALARHSFWLGFRFILASLGGKSLRDVTSLYFKPRWYDS